MAAQPPFCYLAVMHSNASAKGCAPDELVYIWYFLSLWENRNFFFFFFLMALFKLRSVRETYDVESSETIKGETGKGVKTCVDQIVCGGVGIQTSYF